jgi:F-type H+-transporting ATPase subunit b
MLFDWFTVVAQLINFLVLVWLMKRFLYKPILNAIDAREQLIAKKLSEADTQRIAAENERETLRQKNHTFDEQRNELLRRATDEANAERRRLLDEARQAAEAQRAQRQEALRREQQSLNDEITRRTGQEVFAIARKTLADLAGATLEARMSEVFGRRLKELDIEAKEDLATAMKTSSDPALVRSALALSAEQVAGIRNAIDETFAAEIDVRFETAPDVISGIELTVNGRKIAWSIAHYLVSLQESIGELLKESSGAQVNPETAAPLTPGVKMAVVEEAR